MLPITSRPYDFWSVAFGFGPAEPADSDILTISQYKSR
jgi:hypothetical protein